MIFSSARSGNKRNQLAGENLIIIAVLPLSLGCFMFPFPKLTDFKALSYQERKYHTHWLEFFPNQWAWVPLFNHRVLLEHSLPALNSLTPSVEEGPLVYSQEVDHLLDCSSYEKCPEPASQVSQLY